jgi:hypothetical protein
MKNFKLIFLLVQINASYGATVDTLQVPVYMNKIYKAAVVLPNSYTKSRISLSCTCFTAPMVILTIGCLKLPIKL